MLGREDVVEQCCFSSTEISFWSLALGEQQIDWGPTRDNRDRDFGSHFDDFIFGHCRCVDELWRGIVIQVHGEVT